MVNQKPTVNIKTVLDALQYQLWSMTEKGDNHCNEIQFRNTNHKFILRAYFTDFNWEGTQITFLLENHETVNLPLDSIETFGFGGTMPNDRIYIYLKGLL